MYYTIDNVPYCRECTTLLTMFHIVANVLDCRQCTTLEGSLATVLKLATVCDVVFYYEQIIDIAICHKL